MIYDLLRSAYGGITGKRPDTGTVGNTSVAQRIAGIVSRRFKATDYLHLHTASSSILGHERQDPGFHSRQ
jgi:hypothetical protein